MHGDLFDIFHLIFRQGDAVTVAIERGEQGRAFFALQHRGETDAGNGQVCRLRHARCPGKADLVRLFEQGAGGGFHAHAFGYAACDTLQEGAHLVVEAVVVAQEHFQAGGVRAGKENTFCLRADGQDVPLGARSSEF